MKVEIWITTDDGGGVRKKDLSWSEACAAICHAYFMEQLEQTLVSDMSQYVTHSEVVEIIEKELGNESNKN